MSHVPVCRWMSVRSAALYLDVSVKSIYAWCSDGTLGRAVARIRRRNPKGCGRHTCTIRIDRIALDRFLEARAK